ncbi:MAG: hypothetical protein J6S00_07045, partial [Clostridia bacterium]|nr:hypothetical protein [Clostridia bacterium]
MLKFKNLIVILVLFSVITILIKYSSTAINGAIDGMLICGNRIIPSLFPFTAVSVFLYNGNYLEFLLEKLKRRQQIIIFLISNLGGYPVGAKLISEAYNSEKISKSEAENMLCYSVNVGPAFSVSVVGTMMFNSTKLGVLLYLASIISAFELLLIYGRKCEFKNHSSRTTSLADNFVNSVASASSAMLTVCSFIILFSAAVNVVKTHITSTMLKNTLINLLEVTTAVGENNNVFIIAFLMGFGGLSIFMQILSLSKNFTPNVLKIIFSRILNGIFMLCNTFILIKIFDISSPTITNNYATTFSLSQGDMFFSILFVI